MNDIEFEKKIKHHKDRILKLKKGWGDEPHNDPIDIKSWNKVEKLVRKLRDFPIPYISPMNDGTIDLYWIIEKHDKYSSKSLLLNMDNSYFCFCYINHYNKDILSNSKRKLKKYLKKMYKK